MINQYRGHAVTAKLIEMCRTRLSPPQKTIFTHRDQRFENLLEMTGVLQLVK